ncbi:MAG: hypothetical protein ABSA47_03435 [Verrucomicrobiota bacterium]|jgi:hypothetical protein
MNASAHLVILAVTLLAGSCCPASSEQIEVRLNKQPIEITIANDGATSNVIERLITKQLQRNLVNLAVAQSNASVSDQVLSQCMDLYVASVLNDPTNFVDDIVAKSSVIIASLRRVVVDHEDRNSVFDKYLSGVISASDWEAYLKSNDTVEKITKMESLVPHSVADLKKFSESSVRVEIEEWLLFRKVTRDVKEVVPTADEIQALYIQSYPTGIPTFAAVEKQIKADAANRLKLIEFNKWWREFVAKCEIEIPARFEHARVLLMDPPHPPLLSEPIAQVLKNLLDIDEVKQ